MLISINLLDAVTGRKKGNGKDKEHFGDLRQRQQHRWIPDAEAVLIQRIERQIVQKRVTEGIGYLQRRAKQHGEQENSAMRRWRNNTSASSPSTLTQLFDSAARLVGQRGSVSE